jgi:hypothetical protein
MIRRGLITWFDRMRPLAFSVAACSEQVPVRVLTPPNRRLRPAFAVLSPVQTRRTNQSKSTTLWWCFYFGGPDRIRTGDLLRDREA